MAAATALTLHEERAAGSEMARARVARKRRTAQHAPARDAAGSSRVQRVASREQPARIRQRATQAASSRQRTAATFSGPALVRPLQGLQGGSANFGCNHLRQGWDLWRNAQVRPPIPQNSEVHRIMENRALNPLKRIYLRLQPVHLNASERIPSAARYQGV